MALRETPTDALSGMPYSIMPDAGGVVLQVRAGKIPNVGPKGPLVDRNHVFHPRDAVMAGGDGSAALLNSRCQDVLDADHDEYHVEYGGPVLPRTPAERCALVIMAATQSIPEYGLRVSGRKKGIFRLADNEHYRLRTSGEIRVVSETVTRLFLTKFMLAQPIEGPEITSAMIDHFLKLNPLTPADAKEQEHLADLFLTRIASGLVAPVEHAYRVGLDKNLLAPNVPASPIDFVKSLVVISKKHRRAMVDGFVKRLAEQRRRGQLAVGLGDIALA